MSIHAGSSSPAFREGLVIIARKITSKQLRETVSRERVLSAAMDLADESGIDAVTMRELGRRLGIEAASLYNHVSGKDDVLDALVERAIALIEVPSEGVDWKEGMRRRAISARGVFSCHRWAAALIDSRARAGAASLAYVDRNLGVLIGAGFSPAMAASAMLIIDGYIYGFERQQSNLGVEDDDASTEAAQEVRDAIPEGAFPNIMLVATQYAETPFDIDTAFEFGLGLILDGLERNLGA